MEANTQPLVLTSLIAIQLQAPIGGQFKYMENTLKMRPMV